MKIVAMVRTRNEENNIERFCRSYDWVDEILVADGGSTDSTVKLACSFSNVRVRSFLGRTLMDNNLWRNPAGEHINFLIEWAEELDAGVWYNESAAINNPIENPTLYVIIENIDGDSYDMRKIETFRLWHTSFSGLYGIKQAEDKY